MPGTSKVGTSKAAKPAVWERSIGSVGSKASLMKLVKSNRKKGTASTEKSEASTEKSDTSEKKENSVGQSDSSASSRVDGTSEGDQKKQQANADKTQTNTNSGQTQTKGNQSGPLTTAGSSALSMLGSYSDSEESDT